MTIWRSRLMHGTAPLNVALLSGLFVLALALSVLAGWALNISSLRNAFPFGIEMRANAAIGLLLCGMALAVLSVEGIAKPGRIFAAVAGLAVAALGALTLSQDLADWDLGIDQWLFRDTTGTARTAIPGRMTPPTSFSLLLLGTAIVTASWPIPARLRHPILSALGTVVTIIGGVALIGHFSEALVEARLLTYTRIASYTALSLMILGVGLLALVRSESDERWSLDALSTGGFVVGIVAMLVAAGLSYQFTSEMQQDVVQVGRTQEILKAIETLDGGLANLGTARRGYLVTGDERLIEHRAERIAEVYRDVESLRRLTAGVADQQRRVNQLEPLIREGTAVGEKTIAAYKQQEPEASRQIIASGEGALATRGVRRLLDEMRDAEYASLAQQEKQADETSRKTFLLLPLSVLLGLTILALALFFLNANAAARALANTRLAQQRERLSVLHEIDRAIMAEKTPTQIAEVVLPRLREMLGLPRVAVNIFDLAKGESEWLVAVGRHRTHVGSGVRYPMGLMGDLDGLKRGEMQLIDVGALSQRPEAEVLLASDVRWYMVVPMIIGTDLIGGLTFGGPSRAFSSGQIEIAREMSAQVAIAIAQSRLAESAKRADAQYRLVFENVPMGIAMTVIDGSVLSMNSALSTMLGYRSTAEAMMALGERTLSLYVDLGARDEYLRLMRRDRVVTRFETQFRRKDGSLIWVSISGRPVRDVPGDDSLLVTMIDDVTLRKEQEDRIARLSRVKDMHSSINSAVVRIRERQALLDEVCRVAVVHGGFRAAWVAWHDANTRLVRPVASAGHLDGFLALISHSTDVPVDARVGITVGVLRSGVSVVTSDMRTSATVLHRQAAVDRGYLSAMHLPLRIGGAVEGVLVLFASEAGYFDDDEERRLLDDLAADVSFALESLHKSERLDYLAYYDPLTGLPNRTLFHDRLSRRLQLRVGQAQLVAIVLLDLERFRRVNESHGRHAGDALLRDIGARLLRANDAAARIGVDVFGLVLEGARSVAEVNRAVVAIVAACFTDPIAIGGEELRVTCRAGLSVHPHDGADADTLLRNAEAALRRSKGTDERIVFYAAEMNARVAESLAIENKLRRAIERREFVLHYQPKVDLPAGRITGLEALIRWQDPENGLIPPGRFIPILEETGMIVEVGRWAVEQAFVDLRAWAANGLKVPRVAVNVSAIQLQRRDFVDSMIEEIRRGGDSPEWLELEITESLVMHNVDDSTRKLSILRGMGVTVSIDDFGTGYSSLSYLTRLPVDSLKIDGSFVTDMTSGGEAESIVSTIIGLAHGLKLKVVAEAVETREQAEMLHRLGCDQAQGFFYSRPAPASKTEELLRAGVALPVP